jgi:hypothetical protein
MWSMMLLAWAGMDMTKPCMCVASLTWQPRRDVSLHPNARSSMSCPHHPSGAGAAHIQQ